MTEIEFCEFTGLERVHRHLASKNNTTDTSLTIRYDLPELHENGIHYRKRYVLEVDWTFENGNTDQLFFKKGRLVPYHS